MAENLSFLDSILPDSPDPEAMKNRDELAESVGGYLLSPSAPPQPYNSASKISFDMRIPFEIALGIHDPESIRARYEVDPEAWAQLQRSPDFRKAVESYQKEMASEGLTFRLKAAIQAEALLETSWLLIHDERTPASVKADLLKWTAKVADLEPKKEEKNQGMNFNLQINI